MHDSDEAQGRTMESYNNQCTVSIIMPAYNTEKFIGRGIDSCLQQTYRNWELLVIDDGSEDETVRVVREYQRRDGRIHLTCVTLGGVSKARNRGIESAEGEYIVFLDSDDWLEKDALEQLIMMQQEHPAYLIACDRFSVHASETNKELAKIKRPKNSAVLSREQALLMTGKEQYNNSSVNKLFRRNIMEEYAIRFDPAISYGEDELLVFEYLLHTDGMVFTERAFWNVLERSGSATRDGFRVAFLTSLDAVEQMMSCGQKNGIDQAVMGRLMELKIEKARNLLRRYLEADADKPEALKQLRSVLREDGRKYCHGCSRKEAVKIYAAAYCPWGMYRRLYGTRKRGGSN